MTTYDLTTDERKALNMFGIGMFASVGIIIASVMIGLFIPNQLHGRIIMIGGAFVGYVLLRHTTKENDAVYKKLYPDKEE